MKIYIAGPISNNPNYKEQFQKAHALCKRLAWTPINPVDSDDPLPHGWQAWDKKDWFHFWVKCMRKDLPLIASVDALALIPGWEDSPGACLEVVICFVLGYPIFKISDQYDSFQFLMKRRKDG